MNDIVLVEGIKSLFWLLIWGVTLLCFREEVRGLLRSLGRFKVAGATFELRDRQETLESYVLLAETLIGIASRTERVDALNSVLHAADVEKLGVFALKYTGELRGGIWNEELLRNVAYLLLRAGRHTQAVKLYDALLKRRPNHGDLLNLKALALLTSRIDSNVEEALAILSQLVQRVPEFQQARHNLALALSFLGQHDEAAKHLGTLLDTGYWKISPNVLEDPILFKTRESQPELLQQLSERLAAAKKAASNA